MTEDVDPESEPRPPSTGDGRRWARWIGLAVMLAALGFGIRISSYAPLGPPTPPETAVRTPLGWAWRGAVEVHSRRSDGSGSVEEIVAAAGAAGLDYVVLTDHAGDLLDEPPLRGGWRGNVLLIVGEEISTTAGHLLALETAPHRYALSPEPVEALGDVRELGGWAVIAHPLSGGGDPWTAGWGGFAGVETMNLSSAWYRATPSRRLWALGTVLVDPSYAASVLVDAAPDVFAEYDRRTRFADDSGDRITRPMAALGALDAHGSVVALGELGFPGYRRTFGVLHQVVWIDRPPGPGPGGEGDGDAIREILDALRRGRSATVVDAVGRAPRFRFLARRPAGRPIGPGGWAPWQEGPWTLEATLGGGEVGGPYRMLLRRDGEIVATTAGEPLSVTAAEPGTYRLEVLRGDRVLGSGGAGPVPWIATNPVYVWPADAWRGAWPRPAPRLPLPPTENLADTGVWKAFSAGRASSRLDRDAGGPTWRLEVGEGDDPDRYAALRWKPGPGETTDWSGARGLGVLLRSREPLRIRVEVRTRVPGGRVHGWRASVKAAPEDPGTALSWERLVPFAVPGPSGAVAEEWSESGDVAGAGPTADDLRHVRSVYLTVGPSILRSGSRAEVRIATLGPYGGSAGIASQSRRKDSS